MGYKRAQYYVRKKARQRLGDFYFRIFYIEPFEEMPIRSDLCISARDEEQALIFSQYLLGNDFIVLKVEQEDKPTNIISLKQVDVRVHCY